MKVLAQRMFPHDDIHLALRSLWAVIAGGVGLLLTIVGMVMQHFAE